MDLPELSCSTRIHKPHYGAYTVAATWFRRSHLEAPHNHTSVPGSAAGPHRKASAGNYTVPSENIIGVE